MNLQVNAQSILNFKVKNSANEKDRTMMLDILRATMYKDYKQEFIYKVEHFKVGGGYAYFTGEALRKDGQQITWDEEEAHDCCFVGAVFRKKSDKWYMEESCIFPTDMCNAGISQRYPKAPVGIFDELARSRIED